MVKIRSHILNPLGPDKINLLTDHVIVIVNDEIQSVRPFDAKLDSDSEDRRDCLVLPGLIDLHVHLSQYRIRGNHRPALLPWLKEVVFPEEAKSVDQDFAAELAKDFFHALFRNGTTTSVIYTAGFKSACDTAFQIARELGARAFIGMTM
ncbi:MAG: amidohydrolase family protein, partial [Candidatus Cloacimonadaceae bacterium]|nr:amidohydrolase family protein [Candidatus Cloacimonadaceae bacterium]